MAYWTNLTTKNLPKMLCACTAQFLFYIHSNGAGFFIYAVKSRKNQTVYIMNTYICLEIDKFSLLTPQLIRGFHEYTNTAMWQFSHHKRI